MIKIVSFVISLGLSIMTVLLMKDLTIFQSVLLGVAFFVLYFIGCIVLFFFLAFLCSFYINTKKKPTHYSKKVRKIYNFFDYLVLSLYSTKIITKGLEKVPDGTIVVISNHISNVDPLVMNQVYRKRDLIFASKKSLFKVPFFGRMIHKIGYLKFDRVDSLKDLSEIKRGVEWVKNGVSLVIYPEGTRNKTNDYLLEFKEQVMKFATLSKTPLVISGIYGTKQINDNLFFKRHKVYYEVLDVINPSDYSKMSASELSILAHNKIEEWVKEKSENV